MTTPANFTFLDGLLQGQASLAISAGAGVTISSDTWGNASTTTPLIVLCAQACDITLPSSGDDRTANTQIIVIKTGTTDYTVNILRAGALINGAGTDDQFTGTATGIYRYNSDGTNWFREISSGGGGGGGAASVVVNAGSGVTISASTWGSEDPSVPLIVLCDQAATVTMPTGGDGISDQSDITVIKIGSTNYDVDIDRNGGLINGVGNDDILTGAKTGIYQYHSDGTDWFREPQQDNRSVTISGTSYTAVLASAERIHDFTNAAAVTFTIPENATTAFPEGTLIYGAQIGAGQVTVTPASGSVNLLSATGLTTIQEGSTFTLRKYGTNDWVVWGDLA